MRKFVTLIIVILGSLGWAYEQIIPVVAKASGGYGSVWQSDLTLYNAGHAAVDVTLDYLPAAGTGPTAQRTFTISPGEMFEKADLLGWLGREGTGSLTVTCPDEARTALGVASRTYAVTETGTFGQAVPAVPSAQVVSANSELYLWLPPDGSAERFNFGIRTLESAAVDWQLLASDGSPIAQVSKTYAGPVFEQYTVGVQSFFGTDQEGRVIRAVLTSGRAVIYGSRVDNGTNDGAFFLAQALRSNQPPVFMGIDASSDGDLDFLDANGDNILDSPIPISVSFLFNYAFTISARDPEGDPLTFSLQNAPKGMTLLSETAGTVFYAPSPTDLGKTIHMEVKISDGFGDTIILVPLQITP